MAVFDSKNFNAEVFGRYLETVPRLKQNALLKAGVLRTRSDLKSMLTEQTGGNFITVPMTGLIGGDALNYDGSTDITATSIDTYLQSMIVVGRAKAWQEKDFSEDITGKDFMEEIARQTSDYWDDVNEGILMSILKGIFAMTGNDGFADKHTLDITGEANAMVGPTTLNTAIQKAAGDNKNIFTLAILNSAVATNLENLELLEYRKQTDANGIQRTIALADWNGRTVLVDDDLTADTSSDETVYTSYILGSGAFDYCDCGAAVPSEMWRDPKSAGGVNWLIHRERLMYAPRGISFKMPSTAIISPTNDQLASGSNWALVKDSAGSGFFNHRSIPIARILSKG
jgi:hypothetical protein